MLPVITDIYPNIADFIPNWNNNNNNNNNVSSTYIVVFVNVWHDILGQVGVTPLNRSKKHEFVAKNGK